MNEDAVMVSWPGPPSPFKKNALVVRFNGPKCPRCKRGLRAFVVPGKPPASLTDCLPVAPVDGPVMVSILARWPSQWVTSRAPGRPQGDADAPVSAVMDAFSGHLYHDDAQVAVVVAVNAYDKAQPRLEATVAPLSARLLAVLEDETGLGFTSATLSTGQQEGLAL
jgi:hypothetical protein